MDIVKYTLNGSGSRATGSSPSNVFENEDGCKSYAVFYRARFIRSSKEGVNMLIIMSKNITEKLYLNKPEKNTLLYGLALMIKDLLNNGVTIQNVEGLQNICCTSIEGSKFVCIKHIDSGEMTSGEVHVKDAPSWIGIFGMMELNYEIRMTPSAFATIRYADLYSNVKNSVDHSMGIYMLDNGESVITDDPDRVRKLNEVKNEAKEASTRINPNEVSFYTKLFKETAKRRMEKANEGKSTVMTKRHKY